MTIVVAASDEQWNELNRSGINIDWQRVNDAKDFDQHANADAFFSLKDDNILAEFGSFKKPVFINSVVDTLADLQAAGNILRINGWATFLSRPVWEVAGHVDENTRSFFNSLNIKINVVKDEPGFISARIIAMIINEAYFAVEDDVSSKNEIDTAMKLGTNYPYGPFEWAQMIGIKNILALLQKLNITDVRYQPSALLIKEATANNS
jgi:3-hydroxybutyryl-CoA dehydrogenase